MSHHDHLPISKISKQSRIKYCNLFGFEKPFWILKFLNFDLIWLNSLPFLIYEIDCYGKLNNENGRDCFTGHWTGTPCDSWMLWTDYESKSILLELIKAKDDKTSIVVNFVNYEIPMFFLHSTNWRKFLMYSLLHFIEFPTFKSPNKDILIINS